VVQKNGTEKNTALPRAGRRKNRRKKTARKGADRHRWIRLRKRQTSHGKGYQERRQLICRHSVKRAGAEESVENSKVHRGSKAKLKVSQEAMPNRACKIANRGGRFKEPLSRETAKWKKRRFLHVAKKNERSN